RFAARLCVAVGDLHGDLFVIAQHHRRLVAAVVHERVVQAAETRARIERDVGKAIALDAVDDDVGLPSGVVPDLIVHQAISSYFRAMNAAAWSASSFGVA